MSETKETRNVFLAWNAVMADVRSLAKDDRNKMQGFNFRGIDAVLNAVGPYLRKHGVAVVPFNVEIARETYKTSKGTTMTGAHTLVTFRVYGPDGSHFDGQVPGEASDAGDKSTTKSMSVALRTFLLQALCLPTEDEDPDAISHERAAPEPVDKRPNFIEQAKRLLVREIGVKSKEDVEAVMDWLGIDPSITTGSIKSDWKHAADLCQAIAGKSAETETSKMLGAAKGVKEAEQAIDNAFPADGSETLERSDQYPAA